MFTKIGRLAVVIAAAGILWPVTVSWAGDRSLQTMRAKDYMILESMRLKGHGSEPILAAMETADAIPDDELGDLRAAGFDTFFLIHIAGTGTGGGSGSVANFGLGDGVGGGGLIFTDGESENLTVLGDFNGGQGIFQINIATGSDQNVFTNILNFDIAMFTVASDAQLSSVMNAVQNLLNQ